MTTTERRDEIQQIVSEEMDRSFAEQDRHGHVVGSWPALCTCGWEPKRISRNGKVSVGVHVAAARKKAKKIAENNIKARMTATRRHVN